MLNFTFPNYVDMPTRFNQLFFLSIIPLNVFVEFIVPEFNAAFRRICKFASFMPVPEATMHKNYSLIFRKGNIRCPWQICIMQRKSKSLSMQHRTNNYLRFCIATFNTTHIPASLFFCKNISHNIKIKHGAAHPMQPHKNQRGTEKISINMAPILRPTAALRKALRAHGRFTLWSRRPSCQPCHVASLR